MDPCRARPPIWQLRVTSFRHIPRGRQSGRYADAEPLFKRSLAIREKALGPDHPAVALLLNNLAALHRAQGRYVDAEPLSKRSGPVTHLSPCR
jgi:hypothetical protein